MGVIEYAEQHMPKEYEELQSLILLHSTGTRKSKSMLSRIRELIMEIGLRYDISKFADYSEVKAQSENPSNVLRKFKSDTKYCCGLWISDVLCSK